jgi:hypothetical protein
MEYNQKMGVVQEFYQDFGGMDPQELKVLREKYERAGLLWLPVARAIKVKVHAATGARMSSSFVHVSFEQLETRFLVEKDNVEERIDRTMPLYDITFWTDKHPNLQLLVRTIADGSTVRVVQEAYVNLLVYALGKILCGNPENVPTGFGPSYYVKSYATFDAVPEGTHPLKHFFRRGYDNWHMVHYLPFDPDPTLSTRMNCT